jgi:hypothetical protein
VQKQRNANGQWAKVNTRKLIGAVECRKSAGREICSKYCIHIVTHSVDVGFGQHFLSKNSRNDFVTAIFFGGQ